MADSQLPNGNNSHPNDVEPTPQSQPNPNAASGSSNIRPESSGDKGLEKGPSVHRRFKSVKEAAGKVVQKLHPHPFADDDRPALNHVRHNAAFNPSRVEKEYTRRHGKAAGFADRSRAAAEDIMEMAVHPKKSVQEKIKKTATARFISTQYPYASKTDEYRYLNAQSEVTTSAGGSSDEDGGAQAQGEILENRRDSLRTAWTTAHLRHIRVVPWLTKPFPQKENYYEFDPKEQKPKVQWLQWFGHILLYLTQSVYPMYVDQFDQLPFDIVTTRTHVERLVLNSGHWQAWAMDLRSVYRWENPRRTGRWLLTYFALWYFHLIPTFFWSYILYHVLSNRFKRRSLRHLQAATNRVLDRESTAFQLGELLDRHGQDQWIDQIIQDLGPYAQLQLGDMANMLEVLHSFYTWKSPLKTCWSLCFFAVCLACCLFADTQFCIKIVWFVAGGSFFFCWPIASRYPQYRLLVSPLKWVFWGIPTDAELSFKYLRRQAQYSREEIIKEKVEMIHQNEVDSPPLAEYSGRFSMQHPALHVLEGDETMNIGSESSDDDEDWQSATSAQSVFNQEITVSFRAHWEGVSGCLSVYSTGISFRRNHPREELWDMSFQDLEEVWKSGLGGHRKMTLRGLFDSGVLALKDTTGRVRTLDPIKHRDEAFNCLIGFSGLQWQVIPTEPGRGRKTADEKSK
jgi:hypothetical protein